MTIEKTCISCDGHACKQLITTGLVPFNVKIKKIKEYGWTFIKLGGSWKHYCPSCSRGNANTRPRSVSEDTSYWWNKD